MLMQFNQYSRSPYKAKCLLDAVRLTEMIEIDLSQKAYNMGKRTDHATLKYDFLT